MSERPDIVLILTDQERATPPYESSELRDWRRHALPGRRWFAENGVSFERHYAGSTACVPSRPTLLTGQYPDLHGVTQTDGLGKSADDSRMRWLRAGEVPTIGHWLRAAGYDTHYEGKWHVSHADLIDPQSGEPLETNDDAGVVLQPAVDAYLDADPLDAYGFSGWVGPEPHGAAVARSGLVRDPIIARRATRWLEHRYRARRAGDGTARRPFLLLVSFVNPHDIVFWPAWAFGSPLEPSELDPPAVAAPPTLEEDLSAKPEAQRAYRDAYPGAYGQSDAVASLYTDHADAYRSTYMRLHAEVDRHVDSVRRAVTGGGSEDAVLMLTSDHGELLGAHGGLHQKWFNLYDECVRVPMFVARVGEHATGPSEVHTMPTSHVDLVPSMLAFAGAAEDELASELAETHSEVHPLPGHNLAPIVADVQSADVNRPVYVMSRDNILEGDTNASLLARRQGDIDPPDHLRIESPVHVGSSFEAVVVRVPQEVSGGRDHLWKLVRTYDDPATWEIPGVRRLAEARETSPAQRFEPLPDEWELYDLSIDGVEAVNLRGNDDAAAVQDHLVAELERLRAAVIPPRRRPWPYVEVVPREPTEGVHP